MAFFNQLGSFMEIMLGANTWDSPGTLVSSPSTIQSMVSSRQGTINLNSDSFIGSAESYFYNDSMLQLLRSWEMTESLLDIFESSLKEVLQSANPIISGFSSKVNENINKYISDINLLDNILTNLKDDLYYGQRAFYIDYKGRQLYELEDPRNVMLVKRGSKLYGCYVKGSTLENAHEYIPYSKIGYIGFNLSKSGGKITGRVKISPNLTTTIRDVNYYRGNSILKSCLYLLYEHFLMNLLKMLLTIKNSIRPDIIQASINKSNTSESSIVEAITAIETLLNQGEYAFDLRSQNTFGIIQTLYNSVINSVKVVPALANVSNITQVEQPAITEKIRLLGENIEATLNLLLKILVFLKSCTVVLVIDGKLLVDLLDLIIV